MKGGSIYFDKEKQQWVANAEDAQGQNRQRHQKLNVQDLDQSNKHSKLYVHL